jgi:hypothetical protein
MPIDTSSHDACVSTEVSHLKKKGYETNQAVAAAYSICKGVGKKELEIAIIKQEIEKRKANGTA